MWSIGASQDVDLSPPLSQANALDTLGPIISLPTKTIFQQPFNMLTIPQLMNWTFRISLEKAQPQNFLWILFQMLLS
jgi:hypothetical protein